MSSNTDFNKMVKIGDNKTYHDTASEGGYGSGQNHQNMSSILVSSDYVMDN